MTTTTTTTTTRVHNVNRCSKTRGKGIFWYLVSTTLKILDAVDAAKKSRYKRCEGGLCTYQSFFQARSDTMENSFNCKSLQEAVLRLAAQLRYSRGDAWRARLRTLISEELIIQLRRLLRVSGYRAIARLFRTFRHSRVVQRAIGEHVVACNLERLSVFRQLVIDYEEILGK